MSDAIKNTVLDNAVNPLETLGVIDAPKRRNDIFDKAYGFTQADDAQAVGMHPFFKPIAQQSGGTVVVDGREMIITGSNDYLGLTQDARLKTSARGALDNFGTSCTGSRFLTGTLTLHETLENRLAEFFRTESALTFSAGFLGSLAVLSAIAGRHDIFYFDRENHACLYDGARLSYGTLRKYEHNNLDELEDPAATGSGPARRQNDRDRRRFFDDRAHRQAARDRRACAQVRGAGDRGRRSRLGCFRQNRAWDSRALRAEDEVDMILGTFSKSFASVGGFVTGPRMVVNYIKHKARPFIFTAALPAMQMAAALEALEDHGRRTRAPRNLVAQRRPTQKRHERFRLRHFWF